jgi:hypothetical protein
MSGGSLDFGRIRTHGFGLGPCASEQTRTMLVRPHLSFPPLPPLSCLPSSNIFHRRCLSPNRPIHRCVHIRWRRHQADRFPIRWPPRRGPRRAAGAGCGRGSTVVTPLSPRNLRSSLLPSASCWPLRHGWCLRE